VSDDARPPEPPPEGAEPRPPERPPVTPTQTLTDASTDPEAQVETREIPLDLLQAAARQAMGPASGAVDIDLVHVDLVEAERLEAAEAAKAEAEARDGAPSDPDIPAPPAGDAEAEVTGLGRRESLLADDDAALSGLSPIDPRIRERRVAVTRAEGRRRLRILLTLVVIASVIGVAWLVVQSPFLAVRTINVRGADAAGQLQVQQAAKVGHGAALLFVDTGAVAKRVETLSWVAKANVDKDLPNALTITVVQRRPAAWVKRKVATGRPEDTVGAAVIVDRHGRVLGDAVTPPPGIPELKGITFIPGRGGQIRPAAPAAAAAAMPDALRVQTAALVRRNGQYVLKLIHVPDGPQPAVGEVRLGSLEEIGPKSAAALAVIYQLALDGEHVEYVDVRVPGAPATK
jgi:cell division protein FtsQ